MQLSPDTLTSHSSLPPTPAEQAHGTEASGEQRECGGDGDGFNGVCTRKPHGFLG